MRCGKQYYAVKTPEGKIYPGSCISGFRDEELAPFKFEKKGKVIKKREFSKPSSVWANWRDDDYIILKKCADHDFRQWKCPRFIKDKVDLYNL